MAEENVPAPAPTRYDDQILPFVAWVPIGKSNFMLDLQKNKRIQSFRSLWIFYRTQTSSERLLPQLLSHANLLRDTLEITPIDQAHQFVSPSSGDAIMDFVNELGYKEVIHFMSRMATFLTDKANLGSPTKKDRKDKPHVILYCRFMDLIICHLGRIHNIHQRSKSPFHLAEEDLPTHVPKPKATKEKPVKPSPVKPSKMGKVLKTHKGNSSLQLIDEEEPSQPEPESKPKHQGEGDEYDVERAIQMSLESFQE
nr:hypothetical protein [Tanacetum cinerariifolium]